MIISTSSYNVQLTDTICEYVETTLLRELRCVADHVASADVQLEGTHAANGRSAVSAILRIGLRTRQDVVVTTIRDDNLFAAVRRAAVDSAQDIGRQLRRSSPVSGQWLPSKTRAPGARTAPNA